MNKEINFIINKLSYSGYIQEDIKSMTIDIIKDLQKQLEAYENMRKDLLIKLKGYDLDYLDETNEHNLRETIEDLLNILNKVGDDNE